MITNRPGAMVGVLALAALLTTPTFADQMARGVVFVDENGNGLFDQGEQVLSGVAVSNGSDVVLTDEEGRYELSVTDDTIIFVTKPSGYQVPRSEQNLQRFYYIHKPAGSPKLYYPGVPPTGDLPESIDFPLTVSDESGPFKAIFFGDIQPETSQEVAWFREDVLNELIGTDAAFAVSLGDIMFDHLNLFTPYNQSIAMLGIPFYHVLGNHDMNFDAEDDTHSNETFTALYGPDNYSWTWGDVHFITLDTIEWKGPGQGTGNYDAMLNERALTWVKNDLAHVPEDRLLIINVHAPLVNANNGRPLPGVPEFLKLLENRRQVLILSGHSHRTSWFRYTPTHGNYQGSGDVQELNVSHAGGAWWSGPTDYRGIPLAYQSDGVPNGYTIIEFNEGSYDVTFKAASNPADYQMRIYAPGRHRSGDDPLRTVLANVFYGHRDATVEYKINDGEWQPMDFAVQEDPLAMRLYGEPLPNGKPWVRPRPVQHMWQATLPQRLPSGIHVIHVRCTQPDGKVLQSATMF